VKNLWCYCPRDKVLCFAFCDVAGDFYSLVISCSNLHAPKYSKHHIWSSKAGFKMAALLQNINIGNFIEVLEEVLSSYDYYMLCNYPVSFLEHIRKDAWFIQEKFFEGKSEYSVAWNQRNVWWLHVSSKLWFSGSVLSNFFCFSGRI